VPGAFGPPPQGGFGPPPQGFGPPPQGFGPPVAPPPVAPPPEAGPSGRRGAIIVSVVAALALIVGGGVWYATSSGDGSKDKAAAKPSGDRAKARYLKPKEKPPAVPKAYYKGSGVQPELPKKENTWQVKGSWLTEKVFAKASVDKVVGLDATTGDKVWTLPKPGMSCGGSPDLGKGNIAVMVTGATVHDKRGFRAPCTEITAFDVDNGQELWSKSVTVGYQKEKTAFNQVTISGDTVAVGGLYGGAAFDLRSGDVLWEPKQGEKCRDVGYGGGERLVAVRSCGDYGSERFQVQLLDPATGRSKWTHKLPAGVRAPSVVSTEPVVVALDSGEVSASGATDVFSLDEKGDRRTRIALPDDKYLHECGTASIIQDCRGIAAGNGKLYVPTEQRDEADGISTTNDIVVFSLATGKMTGEKVEAGDNSPIFPIRMDGGNVLVYKSAPFTQVVSLDGRTLKKETVLLDAGTRPSMLSPLRSELLFHDNKLYLSSDLISRPTSKGRDTIMMYGFAAK
jgi:outer membrane protein assembly factor BamB